MDPMRWDVYSYILGGGFKRFVLIHLFSGGQSNLIRPLGLQSRQVENYIHHGDHYVFDIYDDSYPSIDVYPYFCLPTRRFMVHTDTQILCIYIYYIYIIDSTYLFEHHKIPHSRHCFPTI